MNKLIWKGKQKDLAALILELQEKNWIEKIEKGNLKGVVESISNLFDFTDTKVLKKSDEVSSLYQIMKGKINKETGKKVYPQVYGSLPKRKKFPTIKKNPKTQYRIKFKKK